ncbi:MAG: formylglycine-generating enzyme family protein [Cyanobacteria bacterium J06597_16]
MKRRRFFQYAGLGSAGIVLASRQRASALSTVGKQREPQLESFEFSTLTLDRKGQIKQQKQHTAQFFSEPLTPEKGPEKGPEKLTMVAIPSGHFQMGASRVERSQKAVATATEFPRHRVKLSSFYMSQHPITQSQWAAVAALPKVQRSLRPAPSHFRGGDLPVESVSWLDAVEFCDRLTQKTGRQYQLPSEAQWEYACRAGTQTPFSTGDTITSQLADYVGTYTYQTEATGKYRQSTTPVGKFSHNAFGLQDMHGNVWEWAADCWHCDYQGAPTNGGYRSAPTNEDYRRTLDKTAHTSATRTVRGGGWLNAPSKIRSASRSGYLETALNRTIGFRVVSA